jgi:transposase
MVRETLEPGAVVQVVADRNGVSTGQLYTWRKEMLAAAVSGFVPVAVTPEAPRIEGELCGNLGDGLKAAYRGG